MNTEIPRATINEEGNQINIQKAKLKRRAFNIFEKCKLKCFRDINEGCE